MPLQDITSITGGYGQNITDWQNGDDRIFTGTVSGILPASDPSFVSFYFTLKANPSAPDNQAIVQKLITQVSGPPGVITSSGGNFVAMLVHVYSGDYEGLVQVGTAYWWDFRGISTAGTTITVATGQVVFAQQVTQSDAAGTPASLRSQGQPQFRGFISANPELLPAFFAISNAGDFYMNSNPANGNGTGWQCSIGGDPGTWVSFFSPNSSFQNTRVVVNSQSPYTVQAGDQFIAAYAGPSSNTVIQLPAATGSGRVISIKKMDPTAFAVALNPLGTDSIDGVNAAYLNTIQYYSDTLIDFAVGAWAQI